MMIYNKNVMPTYLKYKYIFFFISISGRIRSRNIFPAESDPDPLKKEIRILIPGNSWPGIMLSPLFLDRAERLREPRVGPGALLKV